MTSQLAQQLKVEKIRKPTHLSGIAQTEVPNCNFKAEISLIPDKRQAIPLKAVIITKITNDQPGFFLKGVRSLSFLQGLHFVDPNFDFPGRIDMLLGFDILDTIMLSGRHSLQDGLLHA